MVDLSRPDNSELDRGRPLLIEAAWYWLGYPIVRSRSIPWSYLKTMTLRLFGARVGKGVYFKPGVRIKFPWYLTIGDYCWIGENVWIDNLAPVTIGSSVCLSQGAYLCTGNHDWSSFNMRLFRKPITVSDGAWIAAKAVVCPGVTVGSGAVLTAGSVASANVPDWEIHTGNPAAFVKNRVIETNTDENSPLSRLDRSCAGRTR
jgi:putative colanic acid biosynthesis acetyltransferase WcaF